MTDPDFRTYFNRVESCFALKRGQPMLLSPEEYELVEDLYRREIPIELVVRCMDLYFEKQARKKRRSRRPVFLTHLRDDLEELILEFNRKGMGAQRLSGATPGEFVSSRLSEIAVNLERVMPTVADIAREALDAVRELESRCNGMEIDQLESHLDEIADVARKRIFDTLDPELMTAAEDRVRDLMERSGHEMSDDILDRFREEQIMKLLRFPVISLYG